MLYKLAQKTANPSLLVAVCADCGVVGTIMRVLQYLRNSQSVALGLAVVDALVEQDTPSVRVLVH